MPVSPYILVGTQFAEIFPGALGVDDPTYPHTIVDKHGNTIVTGDADVAGPGVGDPVFPIRTNLNMSAAAARVGEPDDVVTQGTGSGTLGDYLRKDGTIPLTGPWDVGAGQAIQTDILQARTIAGLEVLDDQDNPQIKTVGRAATADTNVNIGDVDGVGNLTLIALDDDTQTITLTGTTVVGLLTINDNATQVDGKYIATDQVRARDGDGLKLYDDGGFGIFVEDGGQVGIGTTAPAELLEINGTRPVLRLRDSDSTGIAQLGIIVFWDSAAQTAFVGHASGTNNDFYIHNQISGGNIRLRTSSGDTLIEAGNLGIGAATPDTIFEVETTATIGKQAMTIDQNDADQAFIDFQGVSAADTTKNISTLDNGGVSASVSVAGPKASTWQHQEMVRMEVNGILRWFASYSAP